MSYTRKAKKDLLDNLVEGIMDHLDLSGEVVLDWTHPDGKTYEVRLDYVQEGEAEVLRLTRTWGGREVWNGSDSKQGSSRDLRDILSKRMNSGYQFHGIR